MEGYFFHEVTIFAVLNYEPCRQAQELSLSQVLVSFVLLILSSFSPVPQLSFHKPFLIIQRACANRKKATLHEFRASRGRLHNKIYLCPYLYVFTTPLIKEHGFCCHAWSM
jgi:hypothetical protein